MKRNSRITQSIILCVLRDTMIFIIGTVTATIFLYIAWILRYVWLDNGREIVLFT